MVAPKKQTEPQRVETVLTPERYNDIKDLTLYEALAFAQAEMTNPPKNSTGKMPTKSGYYEFKFAGLDVITQIVRPALNRWGIYLEQTITSIYDDAGKKHEYLHTKTYKGNEEHEHARTELDSDVRDEKKRGAQLSYYERQHIKAAFSLAGDDDISDKSGDYTPEIDKNYYPSASKEKEDKEDKKREEELIRQDKLDHLEDRKHIAKSLGLTEDGFKSWFAVNIKVPYSAMTTQDIDKVTEFINKQITDLTELAKNSKPETLDF